MEPSSRSHVVELARARVPSRSHGAPSALVGRVRFFMGLLTEGLSFSLWGSKEASSKQAGGSSNLEPRGGIQAGI